MAWCGGALSPSLSAAGPPGRQALRPLDASFVALRLGLLAVACTGTTAVAGAALAPGPERAYFGNGCFWARQHLFVEDFERKVLGRNDTELTAITGYAGSVRTGVQGSACYHNSRNFSDYGLLGHAEVVQVDIPAGAAVAAFSAYFNSFVELNPGQWVRGDYFDQGPEYRSVVGFPGGVDNSQMMAAMRQANLHNMTLLPGHGSDPDTFEASAVYVMDSGRFPFIQAELCLQFHDDQLVKYPASYHALRHLAEERGLIIHTACPPNFVCNETATAAAPATTAAASLVVV